MRKKLTDDEIKIRVEAHIHFEDYGDRVRAKAKSTAHSSYDVLRGIITKYAYGRLNKNWQDAEDAVQDAYVSTIETAKVNDAFNFAGLFKIWLDRAIRDKRIEHRRINSVMVEDVEVDGKHKLTTIDMAESTDGPPELFIEMQGKVDEIINVSRGMRPKAKAIVRLVVLFGYSHKEVSEMLHLSVKRVENTLDYFRRKMEK